MVGVVGPRLDLVNLVKGANFSSGWTGIRGVALSLWWSRGRAP